MKVKESVYLGRFLSQDGQWVGELLTKIFVDFAVLIPATIAASGKEMYFPRMGLWLDATYLLEWFHLLLGNWNSMSSISQCIMELWSTCGPYWSQRTLTQVGTPCILTCWENRSLVCLFPLELVANRLFSFKFSNILLQISKSWHIWRQKKVSL